MADTPRRFADTLSPGLLRLTAAGRDLLRRLRVVLVEPRHPGNIGSTARAMAVCGLGDLVLVNPCPWRDRPESRMMGVGAHDLLDRAVDVATLDEALDGVSCAVGTTHRTGRARGPMVPPRALGTEIPAMLREGPVAILFGREDKGLSNDELARCGLAVHIPTADDYPSLNLSHAVMVIAYECLTGVLLATEATGGGESRPSRTALATLAERIARVVERTGADHPRGHVGFARSLREALDGSVLTDRDLALAHMACRELERYIDALERGMSPEDARKSAGAKRRD